MISIIFTLIFLIPLSGAVEYPSPTGYVNDFANMLTAADKERLNTEIIAIEKATTVEIAIVTVESLQGVSVEEYAVKLFEKWGIGKKEKDNGLLILVSKNDREYRIETGYGLEGTINAARAGRIGRDILEPNFKKGEYGEGLYEAVLEIKGLIENEPSIVARNPLDTNQNQYNVQNQSEATIIFIFIEAIVSIFIGFFIGGIVKTGIAIFRINICNEEEQKKRFKLMVSCDVVAIVVYYLVEGMGGLFFVLPFIIILYIVFKSVYGPSGSGGWSGGGRDFGGGSHDGGFGGGFGGGHSGGGGFGGGSSGGGGHSGKW